MNMSDDFNSALGEIQAENAKALALAEFERTGDPSVLKTLIPQEIKPMGIREENRTVATVIPKAITKTYALPKNVGAREIKKFTPWVEQHWHAKNRYPTNSEFVEKYGMSLEDVQKLNASKFWVQALKRRGIPAPNLEADFLSDRQIGAIAVITNYHDVRTAVAKLADLGVTLEEYNGWNANPAFRRAVIERTDTILDNVSSDAHIGLATLIKKGNFPAIKFYYEITGQATSPESINVKQAMQVLIEAVQKHVADPAVLQAIAAEVQAVRGIQGV